MGAYRWVAVASFFDTTNEFRRCRSEQMSKYDWSLLIESCLKQNRYKDAARLFEQLRAIDQLPHERILKFFLQTAAAEGDYESIRSAESMLSPVRGREKFA